MSPLPPVDRHPTQVAPRQASSVGGPPARLSPPPAFGLLAAALRRGLRRRVDLAAALLGLLLALPLLLPEQLPLPGLRGADTETVLRGWELALALRSGHWPPRWMPDALFGLGYPFWNFHGPLPYLGATLMGLGQAGIEALRGALPAQLVGEAGASAGASGAQLVAASRLNLALWLLLSALGAARLLRPTRSALAAALLWPAAALLLASLEGPGAAPVRLAQAALLPWALGAAGAVLRAPEGGALAAGLRWAALLGLLFATEGQAGRPWLSLACAIGAPLLALVIRRRSGGTSAPAAGWGTVASATGGSGAKEKVPSLLRVLLGPAALRRWLARREQRRWRLRGASGGDGAAALAGGSLLGLALAAWLWLPAAGEAGVLSRQTGPVLLGGGRQMPPVESLDRDGLARYESLTGRLATLADAPLPAALGDAPDGGPALVQGAQAAPRLLGGGGRLEKVTAGLREPARRDWRLVVSGSQRASLAFPLLWFPGWEAQVNGGRPRPTSAVAGTGWLQLDLAPGECGADCAVVLRLGRSPLRAAAELVSLTAALVWLLLWLLDRRRRLLPPLVTLLLVWLLGSLLAWLLPRPDPAQAALFAWRPGSGAALPEALPEGLAWEGGRREVRLVDASFVRPVQVDANPPGPREARRDPGLVDAGAALELRLQWRPGVSGLEVSTDWLPAAAPRLGLEEVLAQATATGSVGQELLLTLEPPPLTPDGLYLIRLRVTANGKPLQAEGAGEGDVYLGPLRLRRLPERLPAISEQLAQLGELTLLSAKPGALLPADEDPGAEKGEKGAPAYWLPLELTWRAGQAPALNHRRALRLLDESGRQLAAVEGQPFGGILPTSLWPGGEPLQEEVLLPLESRPAADARLRLQVEVFDGGSGDSVGRTEQAVTQPESTERPGPSDTAPTE